MLTARASFVALLALTGLCAHNLESQAASAAINVASRPRVLVPAPPASGGSVFMATSDTGGTVLSSDQKRQAAAVSPLVPTRSPYVGAQVGYAFGSTGNFASNLVAAGSVLYTVVGADTKSTSRFKFFLPVRGNIAALASSSDTAQKNKIQQLLTSTDGLRIGVEPYVTLGSIGPYMQATLVTSAGWKLNAIKDKNDTTRYLALGRLSAGFEIGVGASDGSKLPITIDANAVYSSFTDASYKPVLGSDYPKSSWSGEYTIVIPVASDMAVLTEAISAQRTTPIWRIGLILVASSSK